MTCPECSATPHLDICPSRLDRLFWAGIGLIALYLVAHVAYCGAVNGWRVMP